MARISKVTPSGRDGLEHVIGPLKAIKQEGPDAVMVRCSLGYVILTRQEAMRIAAWMMTHGETP